METTLAIELGVTAAVAAILGSMLGLGGGVFIVPAFTLFFGVDEKLAIGASAVAVVANSVVGSPIHLRHRFTNVRLAMLLQVTTALGAFVGALIAVNSPTRILNLLFAIVLLYAAVAMLWKRSLVIEDGTYSPDPLNLKASYLDPASDSKVTYVPQDVPTGLGISGGAGVISGMLGIGGGVIQVPAMNLVMRVPVKAAAGSSAFMVGITAVATAFVFYSEGKVSPQIVAPTLIGVFAGSQIGSRLTGKLRADRLTMIFVIILCYLGVRLLMRAAGVEFDLFN